MRFIDLVVTSLASLRQRLFRTSLTVLGVIIGTTAVVVMVSLGVGMSASLMDQVAQSSSLRLVSVSPGTTKDGKPRPLDAKAIADISALPNVSAVNPIYQVSAEAKVGRYHNYFQINAMSAQALADMDAEFTFGQMPTSGDPLGVVLGGQVGQLMSDPAGQPPAEPINWQESSLFLTFMPAMSMDGSTTNAAPPKKLLVPVVGELRPSSSGWSQTDYTVYADLDKLVAALKKLNPGKALPGQDATATGAPRGQFLYSTLEVQAATMDDAETLAASITDLGYQAWSNMQFIRSMQSQAVLVQAVFGGIGFISLLVAAIGIANTMMMSVYERTREIGIMKVLGAALGDIRKMFLIESAVIGLAGGLIGAVLSLGLSGILNATLGSMGGGFGGGPMRISIIPLWLMLSAIAFSTLIGMVAGFVPAQRAMRLSPLAAIRSQ